jgi:hypothetical protein
LAEDDGRLREILERPPVEQRAHRSSCAGGAAPDECLATIGIAASRSVVRHPRQPRRQAEGKPGVACANAAQNANNKLYAFSLNGR